MKFEKYHSAAIYVSPYKQIKFIIVIISTNSIGKRINEY